MIRKIATEDQLADIFTKGVKKELFIPLRDKLMGWSSQGPSVERVVHLQCCFSVFVQDLMREN